MTITRDFSDVEHGGDAQEVWDIITANGGKIIGSSTNYDAETMTVTFEVEDYKLFKSKTEGEYRFD